MAIKKVSTSVLEEIKVANSIAFSFPNARANEFRTGVLKTLRGHVTDVYAMPEAIEAFLMGEGKFQVAHMGDVNSRYPEYTDGINTVYIVPSEHREIAVFDFKSNNDTWDKYANLTIEEKEEVLREKGAVYLKPSVRGTGGFDDIKTYIKKEGLTLIK